MTSPARAPRTVVVTAVHQRHEHLRRQQDALARSTVQPDLRVVVAMDDDAVDALVPGVTVLHLDRAGRALPLAAARNAGAEAAVAAGAELLVFLDVDCLPGPGLVGAYRRAATGAWGDQLLSGAVAYLPPPPPEGYDLRQLPPHRFHPARPVAAAGTELAAEDHRLFWSLSFALTVHTWRRVGGFDEAFEGYGAEDTDLAMRARAAGVGLVWVGGAEAFHQWHETSTPPVQHLDDILRNGALFADRWGWWPMEGWLQAFAERGLVRRAGPGWVRR